MKHSQGSKVERETRDSSAAPADVSTSPDRLNVEIRHAEMLFQRLISGAVPDDTTRAEFAAALERCGLTPEQRELFLQRFLKAADEEAHSEAPARSR